MILPLDEAIAQLQDCFDVPGEALERAATILELQHAALAADPPRPLPASAAVASAARLSSGHAIIPRERWPIETPRVARLLRVLGGAILPGSALESLASEFVEAALPAAQADDGAGVVRVADRMVLPAEASAALLREALKPEMLRLSLPFGALIDETPRPASCPACGQAPCAGTLDRHACCRWCGTTWRWDMRLCPACAKPELAARAVERLVKGTSLLQCRACGDALHLFPASPDPLLLSMMAVLASPLDLALRVAADASPRQGFAVF